MCINNNNEAVINNNYVRLQDLILFFKLSVGTREDFIEICGQFGRAPSKKGSPVLYEFDVEDFY
jgi:hypothetical protein